MTRSLFGTATPSVEVVSTDGTVKVQEAGRGRYDVSMNLDSALFKQTVNSQAISLNFDADSLQEDPTLGLQVKLKTPLSALDGVGLETNANQFVVDPTFNQLNLAVPAAMQQGGNNPNGTPLGNLAFKSAADYASGDVTNKPALGALAAKNAVDYATADVINKPAIGALAPLNALDYLSSFLSNKPVLGSLSPLNVLDYGSALLTNKPILGALSPLDAIDYASNLLTNKPTLGTLAAKNAVDYATTDVTNKPALGALAPLNVLDYNSALLINKPSGSATAPPYTWKAADGTTVLLTLDANGELTLTDTRTGWAYPLRTFAANASAGNGVIWQYGVNTSTNNCAQIVFNYAGSGSTSNSMGFCLNGPDQTLKIDGNSDVSVTKNLLMTGAGTAGLGTLRWPAAGLGPPTFNTRSAGTRLVLYPSLGAAAVDYGIGTDNSTVWFSTANLGHFFRWYLGTTNVLTLQDPTGSTGSGCLVFPALVGAASPTTASRSAGTKVVYWTGNAGQTDYAVGIEGGGLWHSVPTMGGAFRWYFGSLSGLALTINGGVTQLTAGTNNSALRLATTSTTGGSPVYLTCNALLPEPPDANNVPPTLGSTGLRWGQIYSNSTTISTSDEEEKTDVQPLALGLPFLQALQPISFRFAPAWSDGRVHVGLGARATQPLVEASSLPDWALVDTPSDAPWGMRQAELIPVLINAIKELSDRVTALESRPLSGTGGGLL
jgi:hypothetical protein